MNLILENSENSMMIFGLVILVCVNLHLHIRGPLHLDDQYQCIQMLMTTSMTSTLEQFNLNGTNLHEWTSSSQPHHTMEIGTINLQYSRNELLGLRNKSSTWLPYDTYTTIKNLGLFRNRSRRAGTHIRRKPSQSDAHSTPVNDVSYQSTNISTTDHEVTSLTNSSSTLPDGPFINIGHWNAWSIKSKSTTCLEYTLEHGLDAVFLTETWLSRNDEVVIGEIAPHGYSFFNIPRATEDYGGLGVIFRSVLKLELLPSDFKTVTFEHALVFDKQRKVIYVLVYRPPPSTENGLKTSEFLSDFDDFLMHINSFNSKVILLGDFNVHVDISHKPDVKHFLSSTQSSGFFQHVFGPTHKHGHTLDLLFSRPEDDLVKDVIVGTRLSDHHFILCTLSFQRPDDVKKVRATRNFREIDQESMNKDLATNFDLHLSESTTIDELVSQYNDTIKDALDKFAPISERTRSSRVRQPWYTSDIHKARRKRRRLEKQWRKSKSEVHHELYIEQNKLVNSMIDDAKVAHYKLSLKMRIQNRFSN